MNRKGAELDFIIAELNFGEDSKVQRSRNKKKITDLYIKMVEFDELINEKCKEAKKLYGVNDCDVIEQVNTESYGFEQTSYDESVKEVDKVKSDSVKQSRCNTYLMKDENTGLYKIGKSIKPKYRERTLQSEKPSIKMVWNIAKDIESYLHDLYKEVRVRGEWFSLNNIQVKYICTQNW